MLKAERAGKLIGQHEVRAPRLEARANALCSKSIRKLVGDAAVALLVPGEGCTVLQRQVRETEHFRLLHRIPEAQEDYHFSSRSGRFV